MTDPDEGVKWWVRINGTFRGPFNTRLAATEEMNRIADLADVKQATAAGITAASGHYERQGIRIQQPLPAEEPPLPVRAPRFNCCGGAYGRHYRNCPVFGRG